MKKKTTNCVTTILGVLVIIGVILGTLFYNIDWKAISILGILGLLLIYYKNDPLKKLTGVLKVLSKFKSNEES
jgi:hypothetical protein